MRLLFLSNTRTNENEEILNLISSLLPMNSKIGYIPSNPDNDRKYFKETENWFKKIGNNYIFEYLDIHNRKDWQFNKINNFDGFFISGGNTYNLLRSVNDSGMAEALKKIAKETEKPIIGVSAGGIILTPNISIASDEQTIESPDHIGLNLVGFGFCPHFDEGNLSKDQAIANYKQETGIIRVYAVPDTSAVFVEGHKIKLITTIYSL